MHQEESAYELVQPPQHVTLDGAVEALLLGRWKDQSMVLVGGHVEWVRAADVQVDWAPWSSAVAANA
jgi:hypothetical protein